MTVFESLMFAVALATLVTKVVLEVIKIAIELVKILIEKKK